MPDSLMFDIASSTVDALLADVARKIQLSDTNDKLARERYNTIAHWIERDGSPLRGLVTQFYAQGSMAINATISSKLDNDEFDIDVVAELGLPRFSNPKDVLDLLYIAIRGERGSRYYDNTHRQTRCVTVEYSDMHLDVTPSILIDRTTPRISTIFHHKPGHDSDQKRIIANPFGFTAWFNDEIDKRIILAREALHAKADIKPVPARTDAEMKSNALLSLQLLKRWRNKVYDSRKVRKPPSVALAKMAAELAGTTDSLCGELIAISSGILLQLQEAKRLGKLLDIRNPTCAEDKFTDRWPENSGAQEQFINDLSQLIGDLRKLLVTKEITVKHQIMIKLFGERPVTHAFESFYGNLGKLQKGGNLKHHVGTSAIITGNVGLYVPSPPKRESPVIVPTRSTTYFGM